MSSNDFRQVVLDALRLPPEVTVGARIAKKTLLDNTSFAAADKRALNDGIDELRWVAKLAPSTAGIAAGSRYGEIEVFSLRARASGRMTRVIELIHRGPAYPVLLISSTAGDQVFLSAAHVRPAANDPSHSVTEDLHLASFPAKEAHERVLQGFLDSLALAAIRPTDLDGLLDAWTERIDSLDGSRLAGAWPVRVAAESSALLRDLHSRYQELTRELYGLTRAGEREHQLNRLVDVNLARQRIETERQDVLGQLARLTGAEGANG